MVSVEGLNGLFIFEDFHHQSSSYIAIEHEINVMEVLDEHCLHSIILNVSSLQTIGRSSARRIFDAYQDPNWR